MNTKQRRIVLFLVIDMLVVAGLAVWWINRQPTTSESPTPPVAVTQTVAAPAAALLVLPEGVQGGVECHGTWNGQPFWLRLSDPDPALNGNRRLRLVYTPPAQTEVEGAIIHDSPELIVDPHLRIVQWDNRDGATGVMVTDPGYKVMREIRSPDHDTIALKTRSVKHPAAWDLRLSPLMAVLIIAHQTTWNVSAIDFWGPRASERLQVQGDATTITVAGTVFTLRRADDGRVASVNDAQGQAVITVAAWK